MEGWTLPLIFALAGVGLVIVAIVDGGLVIKEVTIPPLSKPVRIISGIVGVVFLCVAFYIQQPPQPPPNGPKNALTIYADKQPDGIGKRIEELQQRLADVEKQIDRSQREIERLSTFLGFDPDAPKAIAEQERWLEKLRRDREDIQQELRRLHERR